MRLAILLGLFSLWTGGQALAHAEGNAAAIAGTPRIAPFSISAQGVLTTPTLPAITPTLAAPGGPVGPVITSTTTSPLTATVATTATSSLGATPTVTATVAGPPPPTIAVPVVTTDAPLQLNPFDAKFLFSAPRPPMGPFSWACFALMVALLGVSGYFYAVKRPDWKRTNTVLYRAANRWSQPGLWLAIMGLLLILFRLVGLDFFNLRFWLYMWMLALLGVAGWFLFWYRTSYPKEQEKFRKTQRARQYMPGGAIKTPARQPDRTAPKPAPQPRPAQKPSGSTSPAKPSSDRKRGRGR